MATTHDDVLARPDEGIAALTSSEHWTAWLRAQARFHCYSFSNTLLIELQRPGSMRVAGCAPGRTWGARSAGASAASPSSPRSCAAGGSRTRAMRSTTRTTPRSPSGGPPPSSSPGSDVSQTGGRLASRCVHPAGR
jgi:hypothetical protein